MTQSRNTRRHQDAQGAEGQRWAVMGTCGLMTNPGCPGTMMAVCRAPDSRGGRSVGYVAVERHGGHVWMQLGPRKQKGTEAQGIPEQLPGDTWLENQEEERSRVTGVSLSFFHK